MKKSFQSVGAVLILGALLGCSKPAEPTPPPAPEVTVAPVTKQEIVEWAEFTGRTEAVEKVDVQPRVSGHIQEVHFLSGQLVKKGDVLFSIDPRWHEAEFNRRKAEFEQARVRLAIAEREANRTKDLLANKAISTEEAEQRDAKFQEAKAAVLAVEAALATAQLDLEYTQIRSPIDGRVSRALVTEGNYVSGMAGNATLLTTIVSVNPIHVYADVDESALLKFNALKRANQLASNGDGKIPVELQLSNEDQFTHLGFIESFDNRVDPNTGSILLRSVFPNTDGRIVPGLFARIRVPASAKHSAILIDERAIGTDQAQKFVLTLSSTNTVEYRPVKLGSLVDGKRVVREGLKPGEQIVVNGLARVRPGMPVTPKPMTEAKSDSGIARKN